MSKWYEIVDELSGKASNYAGSGMSFNEYCEIKGTFKVFEPYFRELESQLQVKDAEIERVAEELHKETIHRISDVQSLEIKIKTKDNLIRELIECVQLYADIGDKEAFTLLNSEAVKEWKNENR